LFHHLISFFLPQNIVLSLEDRDAEELVIVLCGYHRLLSAATASDADSADAEELNVVRQKTEFTQELGE
jgi:hypothetical protein